MHKFELWRVLVATFGSRIRHLERAWVSLFVPMNFATRPPIVGLWVLAYLLIVALGSVLVQLLWVRRRVSLLCHWHPSQPSRPPPAAAHTHRRPARAPRGSAGWSTLTSTHSTLTFIICAPLEARAVDHRGSENPGPSILLDFEPLEAMAVGHAGSKSPGPFFGATCLVARKDERAQQGIASAGCRQVVGKLLVDLRVSCRQAAGV